MEIFNKDVNILGNLTLSLDNAVGNIVTINGVGVASYRTASQILSDIGYAPQTLSIVGSTITLSDTGGSVTVPSYNDTAVVNHITSTGSDHLYINQNVTTFASPTFVNVFSNTEATANSHLVRLDQMNSAIAGLDWQESILDQINFTTSEPISPSTGDRYVNTTTGVGSTTTSTAFVINRIYEWDFNQGGIWIEFIPNEGWTAWNESIDTNLTFNGVSWVEFGSTVSHNNTTGLQGGTTGEYYHLSSSDYSGLTAGGDTSLHTHTFASLTSKPTTIAGYGITDTYDKVEADGKYLLNTTDTLTGDLTVTGNVILTGTSFIGNASSSSYTPDDGVFGGKITNGGGFKITTQAVDTLTLSAVGGNMTVRGEGNFGSSVSATGAITGSNLSGTNTGDQDLSGYSLTGHSHTFASLTSKPTTISGYGITDGIVTTDARLSDARTATLTGNLLTAVPAGALFTDTTYDLSVYLLNTTDSWSGTHTSSGLLKFTGTGAGQGIQFNSTTVANDAFGIRVNGTSNAGELEFFSTDDDDEAFVWRHYTTGQDGTGSSVEWFRIGAGGNVSAIGTVTGSNLSGTNTGDQDLSSYYGFKGSVAINTNADTLPIGVWKHAAQAGITNFSTTYGTTISFDTGTYYGWQLSTDSAGHLSNRANSNAWSQWYKILDDGNYNNYTPTKTGVGASGTWAIDILGTAANSDALGGYTSAQVWRSDGGVWNPNANISLGQTAANQEWSFDISRNGHAGGYFQVWDSSLNTVLKVDPNNGIVSAPYGFSGSLSGNATTASKAAEAQNNYFNIRGISPSIAFVDTDQAETRYVHHNGGAIGFLTAGGSWSLRCADGSAEFYGSVKATDGIFAGNVGIGMNIPAAKLTLGDPGGATTRAFQIEGNTSTAGINATIGVFSDATYIGTNYYYNAAQVKPVATHGQTAIVQAVSATPLSNSIAFNVSDHTDANSAPDTRMLIRSDGNVGIGTTTPSTGVEIENGGLGLPATTGTDNSTSFMRLKKSTSGWGVDYGLNTIGTPAGWIQARDTTNFATNASFLINPNGGNVGIGTTSPSAFLHLKGGLSYGSFRISPSVANGESAMAFFTDVAGTNTSNAWVIGHAGWGHPGDFVIGNQAGGGPLVLVQQNGNVGIGTTGPTNQLHVHTDTDNAYAIRIEGSTNNGAGVWTGLGIGGEATNSKSALLFEDVGVSYARGKLHLCVNNELNQNIATPADAKLTISNDGNIGIGTTSPGYKLDVSGTGYYSGQLTIDGFTNNSGISFRKGYSPTNTGIRAKAVGTANRDGLELLGYNGIDFTVNNGANVAMRIVGVTGSGVGNVGIGTTSPDNILELSKTVNSGIGPILQLTNNQYTNADNSGSSIQFRGYKAWGPGSTNPRYSEINAINGSGSVPKRIEFKFYADADVKTPLAILQTGNVGIGTSSPLNRTHIVGPTLTRGSETTYGLAISDIGDQTKTLILGYDLVNDVGIIEAIDQQTAWKNLALAVSAGNVGIGTPTPAYKLDVYGTIRATGDVIAYSDVRVKKNINTIENAVNTVNKLRGVTYQKIDNDEYGIGVIAQELEKVLPHLVKTDKKGMKAVAYGNITGVLIEAIKEQDIKMSEQDDRIRRLEALVEQMLNNK